MTKLAAAGLAIGLMLMGASAPGASAAAVSGTCLADLRQLCPSQTGLALKHCRNANRANFSPACKQSLASAHAKVKDIKP